MKISQNDMGDSVNINSMEKIKSNIFKELENQIEPKIIT